MVVCYFWLVTVTNLCHSNKFSLSNQQITFYSACMHGDITVTTLCTKLTCMSPCCRLDQYFIAPFYMATVTIQL